MKNDMFSTVSLSAARMVRRALPMVVAAAVAAGATLTPAFAMLNSDDTDTEQGVKWSFYPRTAGIRRS